LVEQLAAVFVVPLLGELANPDLPLLEVSAELGRGELFLNDAAATEHEHELCHRDLLRWAGNKCAASDPGTHEPFAHGHRSDIFRSTRRTRGRSLAWRPLSERPFACRGEPARGPQVDEEAGGSLVGDGRAP